MMRGTRWGEGEGGVNTFMYSVFVICMLVDTATYMMDVRGLHDGHMLFCVFNVYQPRNKRGVDH